MNKLKLELTALIEKAQTIAALEEARVAILGKKGRITEMMKGLAGLSPDEKKQRGAELNALKEEISALLETRKHDLQKAALSEKLKTERIDVTLPVRPQPIGHIHPVTQTFEEMISIFADMGCVVAEGPDIETDFYNFTALNTPPDHPARQMQDTFYMSGKDTDNLPFVLRTQTSAVQIRTMLSQKPPVSIIAPGRVYRCDHDMTHTPMFHQLEGLVVDETANMGNLKDFIMRFCQRFFGVDDLPIRFRPSFFPFTEPSAEVDIGCSRKGGELKLGAYGDWLEVMGCGMVHPNVLKNCGVDATKYQGFAFGFGVDRFAMLKYGIPDLRTFFDADLRWLKHYGFLPLDMPNIAQESF